MYNGALDSTSLLENQGPIMKKGVSPATAFASVITQDTKDLLLWGFTVPLIGLQLINIFEARKLYDDKTAEASSNGASVDDQRQIGEAYYQKLLAGYPQTIVTWSAIIALGVACAALSVRALRLIACHIAGDINLRQPFTKEDREDPRTVDIAFIDEFYMVNNPNTLSWVFKRCYGDINALSTSPHRGARELGTNLAAIAATLVLGLIVMQTTVSNYTLSTNFSSDQSADLAILTAPANGYHCFPDPLIPGQNLTASVRSDVCESEANAQALAEAIAVLIATFSVIAELLWMLPGVAGVPLVLGLVYLAMKFSGVNINITSFIQDLSAIIEDAPLFLVMIFAGLMYFTGPYALELLRDQYVEWYDEFYTFANKPTSIGGLGYTDVTQCQNYAKTNAANNTQASMLSDYMFRSVLWSTVFGGLMLADISMRGCFISVLHSAGIIDLAQTHLSEKEQVQYLVRNPDFAEAAQKNSIPPFIFARINQAVLDQKQQGLGKKFGYQLYVTYYKFSHGKIAPWAPNLAIYYNSMSLALVFTVATIMAYNAYAGQYVQTQYNDSYNTKYNAQNSNGLCDGSDLYCVMNAAQVAIADAIKAFMDRADSSPGQALYWSPLVAFGVALFIPVVVNIVLHCMRAVDEEDEQARTTPRVDWCRNPCAFLRSSDRYDSVHSSEDNYSRSESITVNQGL